MDAVLHRVSSPTFVGRADELAALDGALGRAAAGVPAFTFVAGESGVGKSRLVAEQQIADHIATAGAQRTARRLHSVRIPRMRGRRSGAPSSPIVPRGRTFPPFAH